MQKKKVQEEESKYTEAELEYMRQKKEDNYAKMIQKYKDKQSSKPCVSKYERIANKLNEQKAS